LTFENISCYTILNIILHSLKGSSFNSKVVISGSMILGFVGDSMLLARPLPFG
jgi:hypothetical protein